MSVDLSSEVSPRLVHPKVDLTVSPLPVNLFLFVAKSSQQSGTTATGELCVGGVMLGSVRRGNHIAPAKRRRIIELVAQGLKNGDVAREIGATEHVVKNCLRAIYDELGLWNRVELALWYEARQSERLREGQAARKRPESALTLTSDAT
jgi:DNA-binding CsgD family transcriptional regulator